MAVSSAAKSLRSIYQLKIILSHIRPPIWRRFLIVSTDSLADLHLVVQIVMGWTDSHLHEFAKGGERYGVPDEDSPPDMHDESEFRIDQVLKQEKDKLRYTYDFGDGWDHDLILEKIIPFETKVKRRLVLKAAAPAHRKILAVRRDTTCFLTPSPIPITPNTMICLIGMANRSIQNTLI